MSISIEKLLQQDPDQLRIWLDQEMSLQPPTITNVNWWLGLAQAVALRATSHIAVDSNSLRWAAISLLIYDFLANKLDIQSKNSHECSAMNLRASLIVNSKDFVDDSVLDVKIVENWFVSRLDMHFDKVVELSLNWKNLPVSDIKRLRDLKNRITPLKLLIEKGYISSNSELVGWLQVREKLP